MRFQTGDKVTIKGEEGIYRVLEVQDFNLVKIEQIVSPYEVRLEEAESLQLIRAVVGTGFAQYSGGVKHDDGKTQWHFLDMEAFVGAVKVLVFGAKKYARDNWKKGMLWSRPYNATLRHLFAFWNGEDLDPETGESHLDHAICELMFLKNYSVNHKELDDRKEELK